MIDKKVIVLLISVGEEKEKKKKKNTGDTKRTARYVIFMDSFYIFSVFSPGSVCFCPLEYAHS